ncbi:MAG: DUF1207 domain-containing protein, partial [Rhodopirellula sp. JB044]
MILAACVITFFAVCSGAKAVAEDAFVANDAEGATEITFPLEEAPTFDWLPSLDAAQNSTAPFDTETPVGSAAVPTLSSSHLPSDSHLPADAVEQTLIRTIAAVRPVVEERDWHVLPDGLMYHSYLAGPQEPRMSAILFG